MNSQELTEEEVERLVSLVLRKEFADTLQVDVLTPGMPPRTVYVGPSAETYLRQLFSQATSLKIAFKQGKFTLHVCLKQPGRGKLLFNIDLRQQPEADPTPTPTEELEAAILDFSEPTGEDRIDDVSLSEALCLHRRISQSGSKDEIKAWLECRCPVTVAVGLRRCCVICDRWHYGELYEKPKPNTRYEAWAEAFKVKLKQLWVKRSIEPGTAEGIQKQAICTTKIPGELSLAQLVDMYTQVQYGNSKTRSRVYRACPCDLALLITTRDSETYMCVACCRSTSVDTSRTRVQAMQYPLLVKMLEISASRSLWIKNHLVSQQDKER